MKLVTKFGSCNFQLVVKYVPGYALLYLTSSINFTNKNTHKNTIYWLIKWSTIQREALCCSHLSLLEPILCRGFCPQPLAIYKILLLSPRLIWIWESKRNMNVYYSLTTSADWRILQLNGCYSNSIFFCQILKHFCSSV